jgi:hypothetical protein
VVEDLVIKALLVQDVIEVVLTITGVLIALIRKIRSILLLFRLIENTTEVKQ